MGTMDTLQGSGKPRVFRSSEMRDVTERMRVGGYVRTCGDLGGPSIIWRLEQWILSVLQL